MTAFDLLPWCAL